MGRPEALRVFYTERLVTECHLTPLGFERQGARLIQNKDEMRTVRSIQPMGCQGLSMQAIADSMNNARAATKRGGNWHAVTIQKILRTHEQSRLPRVVKLRGPSLSPARIRLVTRIGEGQARRLFGQSRRV